MSLPLMIGAFLTCVASGFLPWINAEVVIAGGALALRPGPWWVLVAVAASGQMLAKVGLYALARWAPARLPRRARGALDRLGRLAERPRAAVLAVFSGAAAGLPPLYLVTLAAGVARLPLPLFVAAGTLGVLLRYAVVAWGAVRLTALGGGVP